MAVIDNNLFTQTAGDANTPLGDNTYNHPTQHQNIDNELNSIEDTLVQGYVRESASVSYVSSSSFTVSGDVTAIYTNGRIVRFSDETTGIVSSSSYSAPNTTVNIISGTVPSSLSYVDIAILPKGGTNKIVDVGTTQTITGVKTLNSPVINTPTITTPLFQGSIDGWIAANETWTYSSWDASVYTGVITVPSDATTKYSVGMRIKITQTTGGTKYGIITAVATTSLTVFFGTNYTLNNEAISNPYYSPHKAPLGFPSDPNKWKIEVTDTTNRSKTSPTSGTIYYTEFGSININVPIGSFRITLSCLAGATVSASNYLSGYLALSTSTSSVTDADLKVRYARSNNNLAYAQEEDNPVFLEKTLVLSSKTTYYLILWTDWNATGELSLQNSSQKLILRAVCAYL